MWVSFGFGVLVVCLFVCVWMRGLCRERMGEEDLLGALVALEMIEPAFVIEEKRPPPVEVSWAATREAATTRTEVNFMVIDLLLVLVLS